MIGKYVYKAGATAANIRNDLASFIIGADISTLSANCDKDLTVRTANTGPNNWTIFDAGVTNAIVLRSANEDGVTHKYARLTLAAMAGNFSLASCESWNATSHVGSNFAFAYPGQICENVFSVPPTTGGTIYAVANNNTLSLASSEYGMNGPVIVGEFNRGAGEDIHPVGYPMHAQFQIYSTGAISPSPAWSNAQSAGACRWKRGDSIGDINSATGGFSGIMSPTMIVGGAFYPYSSSESAPRGRSLYYWNSFVNCHGARTAAEAPVVLVEDIRVMVRSFVPHSDGYGVVCLGALKGVKGWAGAPAVAWGDEITIDGQQWVAISASGGTTFLAVPKG